LEFGLNFAGIISSKVHRQQFLDAVLQEATEEDVDVE